MERELLSGLGGGCSVPLGVHSEVETGEFILNGILFSDDCSDFVTLSGSTRDLSDRDFIPNLIYEIRERGKGHLLGEKT
jgi:porphobilinogen deaminase